MPEPTAEINSASLDVITGSVPETKLHKSFSYHVQSVEGTTPLWEEMIAKLEPDEVNQITGWVFNDGTVVWSGDEAPHIFLTEAVGKDPKDRVIHIQSMYKPGDIRPVLWLHSDDEEMVKKCEQYLTRNIKPSAPIDIFAGSREWSGPPRKLNVGAGRV